MTVSRSWNIVNNIRVRRRQYIRDSCDSNAEWCSDFMTYSLLSFYDQKKSFVNYIILINVKFPKIICCTGIR